MGASPQTDLRERNTEIENKHLETQSDLTLPQNTSARAVQSVSYNKMETTSISLQRLRKKNTFPTNGLRNILPGAVVLNRV